MGSLFGLFLPEGVEIGDEQSIDEPIPVDRLVLLEEIEAFGVPVD